MPENDEYDNVHRLEVNPRVLKWMKQNNISENTIITIKEPDWEAWFEQNPQYKDYHFFTWNLCRDSTNKWVQLEAPDGKNAFEELKKIDAQQTEEANVFVFDIEQLDKLKDFSYSPKQFMKEFMKDWKPNHYVLFNW